MDNLTQLEEIRIRDAKRENPHIRMPESHDPALAAMKYLARLKRYLESLNY